MLGPGAPRPFLLGVLSATHQKCLYSVSDLPPGFPSPSGNFHHSQHLQLTQGFTLLRGPVIPVSVASWELCFRGSFSLQALSSLLLVNSFLGSETTGQQGLNSCRLLIPQAVPCSSSRGFYFFPAPPGRRRETETRIC